MNCQSTNGRLDIMQNNLNQFALFDKIPKNECSNYEDALTGNWEETTLSLAFFSKQNIQIIQNAIRAGVYEKSNKQFIIGNQNCDNLKIIMRGVYLQSATNLCDNITQQISSLNKIVVDYCVKHVYGEAKSYVIYRRDVSYMYKPMDRPVLDTTKDKTLEWKTWFGTDGKKN